MSNYTEYDATKFAADEMANHVAWVASLKPGDEVEWRRGERDFDSPDGAWARGAYVGSTDTYRHVVSGWFVSPENIRPVQRDAKPVYVPVDLRVDTPTRFAAPAPASSSSFVSDGSSWHPIPAREAGTDHGWAGIGTPPPKRDYVHDYEGTAVATMHGKTVALCADGRIVVDGEVYVSAVRMDAKDAEAIAKRDAIIAELTERVRVLTPVERKPERGAGLLTMRPMTRVGG